MVMPVVSITWAPAGMLTELAEPTAVIFPPCITTTPFSIAPWLTVRTLPPFRTIGFSWVLAWVEKVKVTSKVKSSGQECPFHTSPFHTTFVGCFIRPPCSVLFPGPVASGRSRLRRRSGLFLAHPWLRVDNLPRSPGLHLFLHRLNLRGHRRR